MIRDLCVWYIELFSGRITTPKEYTKRTTCYIFANKTDLIKYCAKNGIKYVDGKYVYKEYVLINEEYVPNLVAIRITDVVLVSSKVPNLVKEICLCEKMPGIRAKFKEIKKECKKWNLRWIIGHTR